MNGLLNYKPNEKINAIYVRLSVEEKKKNHLRVSQIRSKYWRSLLSTKD